MINKKHILASSIGLYPFIQQTYFQNFDDIGYICNIKNFYENLLKKQRNGIILFTLHFLRNKFCISLLDKGLEKEKKK